MTPEECIAIAVRLFEMNKTLSALRDHIDQAAETAKSVGATELAFATYHLSDSIAVFTAAVNRYAARDLK